MWDDHEVSNNGYRDGSSNLNNTEDSFRKDGGVSVDQRKMNAVRAYFEWMPIRQVDMDNNLRIWRSFSLGKLVDLIMLDTRNYDRSITTLNWNTDYITEIADDAGRTLMGSQQENWYVQHSFADDPVILTASGSTTSSSTPASAALPGVSSAARSSSPAST